MAIKILIVDDSKFIRAMLASILMQDTDLLLEMVGSAEEAWSIINSYQPDVILLDIELPGQNGLDFLTEVMLQDPRPVIMLSSHAQHGSLTAIEALSRGAFDCIAKPLDVSGYEDIDLMRDNLSRKIRAASKKHITCYKTHNLLQIPSIVNMPLLTISGATGAVEMIVKLVQALPIGAPPVLITELLNEQLITALCNQLHTLTAFSIHTARSGMTLERNNIYIAPYNSAFHLLNKHKWWEIILQTHRADTAINQMLIESAQLTGMHIILSGEAQAELKGVELILQNKGLIFAEYPAKLSALPEQAIRLGAVPLSPLEILQMIQIPIDLL